jgi:hypothetical protein
MLEESVHVRLILLVMDEGHCYHAFLLALAGAARRHSSVFGVGCRDGRTVWEEIIYVS